MFFSCMRTPAISRARKNVKLGNIGLSYWLSARLDISTKVVLKKQHFFLIYLSERQIPKFENRFAFNTI